MNKDKAQASIELLITLSLTLLIFIIISFVIFQKFNATTDMKFDMRGQRIANSIAENINEIAIVGDGYSHYFTLPGDIQGLPYMIRFYANESIVEVNTLDMTWASSLSTPRVTCILDICSSDGKITTMQVNETRIVRIENIDGVIYLKSAIKTTSTSTTSIPTTSTTSIPTTSTSTTVSTTSVVPNVNHNIN